MAICRMLEFVSYPEDLDMKMEPECYHPALTPSHIFLDTVMRDFFKDQLES